LAVVDVFWFEISPFSPPLPKRSVQKKEVGQENNYGRVKWPDDDPFTTMAWRDIVAKYISEGWSNKVFGKGFDNLEETP
jgi:hypothetical protein